MKKIILIMIMSAAIILTTGCSNERSTTIIEHDITGVDEITGRMVITIEATGDRVRTWEVITHYNLIEYLQYYEFESKDDIRDWFNGFAQTLLSLYGMTFELIDIDENYVITRQFYDYRIISDSDREIIVGERVNYISLSDSILIHEQLGGHVTTR